MISSKTYFGGQQVLSFSGAQNYCPWKKLIAATATAGGSILGPLPKSTAYFHVRVGALYNVVWNRGATTFTFADAEGEGISEVLTQNQALMIGVTKLPSGVMRWVHMRLIKIGGT